MAVLSYLDASPDLVHPVLTEGPPDVESSILLELIHLILTHFYTHFHLKGTVS